MSYTPNCLNMVKLQMKMCELFVKKCDGMRDEALSESVCVAFDAAESAP